MTTKHPYSFRLDPDLVARFDARAIQDKAGSLHVGRSSRDQSIGRTAVIERLMLLYAEGRLAEIPAAGPNPFPAEEVAAGLTPEFPITITFSNHEPR